MRLLQRNKRETDDSSERPLPDEAPEPQPEHDEAQLGDPGLTDLSKRYQVTFILMDQLFKAERGDTFVIGEQKPKLQSTSLRGLKLITKKTEDKDGLTVTLVDPVGMRA